MSELLPRPIRLLLGATGLEVSDRRLSDAVAGTVVLVTGASSGVGKATALRLGSAGATVLLVARRAELLEEIRTQIVRSGGSASVHPCNLADIDQVGELVSDVLDQHGHVDVVVSNAGVSIRRWISESYTRFHDVQRTIGVNYLGPVRLLLGLLPSMRERGSGHIVNVATFGVNFPPIRWSAYIASKAAFETWLAGVAPEIRADGVTTTSIHMQLVRSPMLGPLRMWDYLPSMSTEEAAGMVSRAIVERPRVVSPYWARLGGAATSLTQAPVEAVLARYARGTNPESRTRAPGGAPMGAAAKLISESARVADAARSGLATIVGTGVVRPIRPDRLARALLAQARFGATPAAVAATAAELYGDRPAVIDELGTITFTELESEARALAAALRRHFDLGPGERVAIMCRNHRGFLHAVIAATRLGCDIVPLNTDFAGPQLADVLAREDVSATVYDQEFQQLVDEAEFEGTQIVGWHDSDAGRPTIEALIGLGGEEPPPPPNPGRVVTLTSGTTGTPRGAVRNVRARVLAPLALAGVFDLGRFKPFPRSGEPFVVAPPLFHVFGLVGAMAAHGLGSPIVIRRRFDSEDTLEQIERTSAGVLLAVPTMLKRIVDLPAETRERYDASSLRMVLSGAAPLSPELANAVMEEFGEILYNGYASTEVGAATLATPADLRAAPGTVGRPVAGAKVKVLDDEGMELPTGQPGKIFVGGPLLFDGYTGGGRKHVVDGLMSTGDVGHFDESGRLFIDGRDDDMILSGGENVFPQEVEDLLISHRDVADAAVFGVPDDEFGQRLAAIVVPKAGARPSEDELKPYVKDRLARHKVPREITFVDDLPRTPTGKLRRRSLSDLWEPIQRS